MKGLMSMTNFSNAIANITKFKQFNSLKETLTENGLKYVPMIFNNCKYGFAILSEEEYKLPLEGLKQYQNKHRYYYYESFENGKTEEVIFIMFNPSSACPDKDDPTIKNCRKLVQEKYKSMEIINIFSERNPNVKNLEGANNSLNIEFITELLKSKTDSAVVLAWGNKRIPEEIRSLILDLQKQNKNILIITPTNTKAKMKIRHPGNQGWCRLGGFNTAKLTNIKNEDITLEELIKV